MSTSPNPAIDLTTVAAVKAWTSSNGSPSLNTTDDPNIQIAISAFSLNFLQVTVGAVGSPIQSPFVTTINYDEWYNGNGNDQLFVKHPPVNSVALLTCNGWAMPGSTGATSSGWVIDQDAKSIVIRGANPGRQYARTQRLLSGWGAMCFPFGKMNVNIQYNGGYDTTPADIVYCATVAVAQNWRRNTDNLDKASETLTIGGTLKFRDWLLPPDCLSIVNNYSRTAIV